MRKIILNLAVSLDGFIEGPNGEYDWCFEDQDYGLTEFVENVDTLFIGRKSYELVQSMTPEQQAMMPKLKEYIFTNSLTEVKPGASIIGGEIGPQVEEIKATPGKHIWLFGGASLTTAFINRGLVDEINMAVHPIVLGAGTPLFQNIRERLHLTLLDSKTYSSGLVNLLYAVNNEQ